MNNKLRLAAKTLIIVLVVSFSLFPLFWLLSISFKTRVDALSMPPKWIFVPTLANFGEIFRRGEFLGFCLNSIIVALGSTALALAFGVPAGYFLARRPSANLSFFILSTRLAPPIAMLIPFFVIFRRLGLTNTYASIIIMHLILNLSLVVWLMRSFFLEAPREMEEAALVDGCGPYRAFSLIALPVCATGVVAAAIFSFIYSWNELLFAMVLSGYSTHTVPVGMYGFITWEQIHWGELAAASIVAVSPVIVFYSFIQKYLIRGLSFGAIK